MLKLNKIKIKSKLNGMSYTGQGTPTNKLIPFRGDF